MQKALLVSILAASCLLPLWAARGREPARALRTMVLALFWFECAYLFGLLVVYPRL